MIPLVLLAGAIEVVAARHEGKLGGGVITWTSTFVAAPAHGGSAGEERIVLAAPLPDGASIARGGTAIPSGAGSAEAIAIERSSWVRILDRYGRDLRRAEVVVTQPAPPSGKPARLAAPIAAGPAVQAVIFTGAEGARFDPDASLGVERYIGYAEASDVSPEAREAYDRWLGGGARVGSDPLYVTGGRELSRAGGLSGAITTSRDRAAPATVAIALAFVAVLAGLSTTYRRLSRGAERERAEAILEAELRNLPQDLPFDGGS